MLEMALPGTTAMRTAATMRVRIMTVLSFVAVTSVAGARDARAWPTRTTPGTLQGAGAPKTGTSGTTSAPAPALAPRQRKTESPTAPTAPPPAAPAAAQATPTTTSPDAAGALERARAAYEYGDIDEMVESARQVSDGRLRPSAAQRASALRYLGIGLFLTGRSEGAETAFFELLRLRPESRLDPQTTRPDAVAFFEQVRLRYAQPIRDAARASNRKTFIWNFLPPAGQIQNSQTTRAITIGGIEVASLATAIASFALLKNWQGAYNTFPGRQHEAEFVRQVNWISVGVLGAAFVYGIIDGIAHYGDPQDDASNNNTAAAAGERVSLSPSGLVIAF